MFLFKDNYLFRSTISIIFLCFYQKSTKILTLNIFSKANAVAGSSTKDISLHCAIQGLKLVRVFLTESQSRNKRGTYCMEVLPLNKGLLSVE